MAAYRYILVLIAFLATCNGAAVEPYKSDTHNIDECDQSNELKTALLITAVYEPAKTSQRVKRTITFVESPGIRKLIKCIRVTNQDFNDYGGYPTLVKGGIDTYDAEILMTSQIGQPLNFRVEIWAE